MAGEHDGGTDARRTLALLWGDSHSADPSVSQRRRGRRPKVSVDRVIRAAVAVADDDGLPALSMAKVAQRLDVGVMTLYGYVPGKAELVDLMVDTVLRERDLRPEADADAPGHPTGAAGWRERVEYYANETVAVHRRHPWLCQTSTARPPLGPGMIAEQEYLLTALDRAGLPSSEVFATASAIITYVTAAARQEAEDAQAERTTGQSWDAWWAAHQDLWSEYFDPDAHPAMTRAWFNGGHQDRDDTATPDARWYGLRLLLDGIDAAARHR